MASARLRGVLYTLLCVMLVACGGETPPATSAPPTQPLNPAPPTATVAVIIPTATLTLPPSAAEIAQTAAASVPTADATTQVRTVQQRLALDAMSAETGLPATHFTVIDVTGVRAGRAIDGCGRARAGMALAYVLQGEEVAELLIDGQNVTICSSANIYDDRPALFLATDPIAEELAQLAILRAARAAGVEEADVTLVSVRPTLWPDASLGCATGTTPEAEVSGGVAGYRIILSADGREHAYHTDFDRIIPCSADGG